MIRRMVGAITGLALRASRRPGPQRDGEALIYLDALTGRPRCRTAEEDIALSGAGGGGGGGGGAPTSSQYVTLATDATLTNERVLTAGHGVDLVDAGAGSTITVDVDETELDHSAITTGMAWSSSGHTGTASRLAGFNLAGNAAYYQIGVDVQAYDAQLSAIAATTPSAGSIHTWSSSTSASVLAAGAEGTSLTIVNGVPAWVALGVASAIQLSGGTDTPIPEDASFVDAADGNAEAFLSFQVP